MANAVFTYSPSSRYDDRQPDHFYAYVFPYVEFDSPVPFREGNRYFESVLMKEDGSTSKGAFGRNVRSILRQEFDYIVAQGFARELQPWEVADRANDPVAEIVERPLVAQVVNKRFRDEAFRRHVREAYGNTCAVTGLCLLNGGGRPEVQAAHIRAVEANGPDTVRNGLALTATVHWMFDRGLISVDESLRLLVAKKGIPQELAPLVQPGRPIRVPGRDDLLPHAAYLRWHREERFKG